MFDCLLSLIEMFEDFAYAESDGEIKEKQHVSVLSLIEMFEDFVY